MYIYVLGSAAGGGFPQWNCNCSNCSGYRHQTLKAQARTQSSIAISENGIDWILINASPDIRQQLALFKQVHPSTQLRGTGIKSIVLMDSQLDHTTGLLSLREGCPIDVWCTEMVYQDLTSGFPVFNMLKHWNGGLKHHVINPKQSFVVPSFDQLEIHPIVIRSAAPPYSPHRHDPHEGDNIALIIRDQRTNKQLFYAPGLAQITPEVEKIMQNSDCIMVDGTLWTNDEMQQAGVGSKTGTEMGHLAIGDPNGSLNYLDKIQCSRKIYIHINNTNPILNENSLEYELLQSKNIEVAYDGMQIEL